MQNSKRISISLIFSNDEVIKLKLLNHFFKSLTQKWQLSLLKADKFCEELPVKIMEKHFDPLTVLIWEPINQEKKCIAVVNSFQDGFSGFLEGFCEKNALEYLYISFSNDSPFYMPYAQFKFNKSSQKRLVYAINDDGRWDFFQEGDMLYFENESYYKRRAISNRLNKDIILEYLLRIGLSMPHPDFWHAKNDSYLFKMLATGISFPNE